MKKLFFLSIFSIIFFVQCNNKKQCAEHEETKTVEEVDKSISDIEKLQIIRKPYDGSDRITIKDFIITGDTLTATVSHSGGCEEHDYELYFNGAYAKSLPVQATFYLKHNSNGDMCKQLVEKDVSFDMSIIKEAHSQVIVSLVGLKKKVEYKSNK